MTEFDDTLRHRLARLDAAIPAPSAPPVVKRSRRSRRRQGLLLVAAAATLFGLSALGTAATRPPVDPAVAAADEERLRDDLGAHIGDRCLSLPQAKTLFRQRLDALGLTTWTIRDDGRTANAPCVSGAPIGDVAEVLMMPSMGGRLATALDAVAIQILTRCATRDDAMSALRATLVAQGVNAPQIATSGIRSVPVNGADDFIKHVKSGCWVYGGAQFDNTGRYTWYVSGP
jgi:hypothetical protein